MNDYMKYLRNIDMSFLQSVYEQSKLIGIDEFIISLKESLRDTGLTYF